MRCPQVVCNEPSSPFYNDVTTTSFSIPANQTATNHPHKRMNISKSYSTVESTTNIHKILKSSNDLDRNGKTQHVLKPTIILTNSEILGDHLARRCFGEHKHGHLKGGDRCAKAAVYTTWT